MEVPSWGDEDNQPFLVLLRELALEGRALGLAAGQRHLLPRLHILLALLLMAVTQLSKSLPGGLERTSGVLSIPSILFSFKHSRAILGSQKMFSSGQLFEVSQSVTGTSQILF